ncbi:hypothetical protein ACM26V_23030 [Salipaludibacillus sp. HK11]|uniref:hypothetical protein n=1 Tax=Salipaludibacillus sp. HK11 TaxID=3394320 RepID=UPI0039FBD4C7
MNHPAEDISIENPKKEDITAMLELNYKIYPKEWHVSKEFVLNIMSKNSSVYRTLKVNGEIKGIYSLFPFSKGVYENILNGKLDESELDEFLLDYEVPKEIYLYLISMIVDIHDQDYKKYTKTIIKDLRKQLKWIKRQGMTIKEVGAIAISDDGKRILHKLGFHRGKDLVENNNVYPVYRASSVDIINAIKLYEE